MLNFPKVIVMSALVAVSGSIYADAGKQELMQLAAVSAGFDVERTYMQNCFACHSTGAAGAPKVGTAADWAPRTEKGIDAMVAIAIKGVNAMPPKGMCVACNDDDIKALVTYMVDSSK